MGEEREKVRMDLCNWCLQMLITHCVKIGENCRESSMAVLAVAFFRGRRYCGHVQSKSLGRMAVLLCGW